MKQVILLIYFLVLVSCGQPTGNNNFTNSFAASSSNLRWPVNAFPLSLKISTDFDTDKIQAIRNVAYAWNDDNLSGMELFDVSYLTQEKNYISASSYLDNEMGIYQLQSWPQDLPPTALAVTQSYGHRRNVGLSSEFIEVFHVDILVNDDYFSFNTDEEVLAKTYDLGTVIVHELGHVLGLNHVGPNQLSFNENSVMRASISIMTLYKRPFNFDLSTLQSHYFGSSQAAQSNFVMAAQSYLNAEEEVFNDRYEGELVLIQHELMPDSERTIINGVEQSLPCSHHHHHHHQ